MTVSETATEVPAASASWSVEQVTAELRETYLAVAAAAVLLERTGAGCAHPAIRLARRSGEDALDLAGDAERQLSDGVHLLRTDAGHQDRATIGALVEVLDTVRDQLAEAAARIGALPARITTAGQQLIGTDPHDRPSDPATETAAGQWHRAADQLGLMTESLSAAVAALTSYTGGLSGAEPATT
ncbi:hypothetical protein F8271_05540 [Micromonospora sp. ALFpr18c]|uniref:hypothetical protein n=1 Tax=Micromonospora sp. ALFpr18c TaxID=1458665 RepID=UPI00124BBA5A|nr:hypothetical protein [Micromonospora sp. ALFpr18c]KAB1946943.1 hypothetical protein F8271_05540 [Micromonospora sp. ALFpr18c]